MQSTTTNLPITMEPAAQTAVTQNRKTKHINHMLVPRRTSKECTHTLKRGNTQDTLDASEDASRTCWTLVEENSSLVDSSVWRKDSVPAPREFYCRKKALSGGELQAHLPPPNDVLHEEVDVESSENQNQESTPSIQSAITFGSDSDSSQSPPETSPYDERHEPSLSMEQAAQVRKLVEFSVGKVVSESIRLPELSTLQSQPQEVKNRVIQCPSKDLVLKEKIGSGGSCDVWEIESEKKHVWKRLSPGSFKKCEPHNIATAVRDLWLEALVLTTLQDHPHIVSLRGWSCMDLGIERLTTTGHFDGFGLILDRVDSTVKEQIPTWRRQERCRRIQQRKRYQISPSSKGPTEQQESHIGWYERLQMARDLASALEYIHEKRIMHRDVKPANVGLCWNSNGHPTVQLLDFGSAIDCLSEKELSNTSARYFQARVGTTRYMAPEVSLGSFYDEKVDVYSFAIVLWELLVLEQPFANISLKKIPDYVTKNHGRPKLPFFTTSRWPRRLRQLLKKAWHPDASRRPSMQEIGRVMKTLLERTRSLPGSVPVKYF